MWFSSCRLHWYACYAGLRLMVLLLCALLQSPGCWATVVFTTAVSGGWCYGCVPKCGLRGEVLTSCSVLQSPTPGASTALNTAVSDTLWYLPLCSLLLSPTHGATVVFSTAVSHQARIQGWALGRAPTPGQSFTIQSALFNSIQATVRWKGSEGSKRTKHTTRKLTPC